MNQVLSLNAYLKKSPSFYCQKTSSSKVNYAHSSGRHVKNGNDVTSSPFTLKLNLNKNTKNDITLVYKSFFIFGRE